MELNTSVLLSSDNFNQLHLIILKRNQTHYILPQGEIRPYFSFSGLANRVSEAQVIDNHVVRHTSVANKWKTIHLLLLAGYNATQIHYNITFQGTDNHDFTISFSVAVDTRELPKSNVSSPVAEKEDQPKPTVLIPEPDVQFENISIENQGPRVRDKAQGRVEKVRVPALNESLLPEEVKLELQNLNEKLIVGDITIKGYNLTKAQLLEPYKDKTQYLLHKEPGEMDNQSKQTNRSNEVNDKDQKAPLLSNGNSNSDKNAKMQVTPSLVPVLIDEVIPKADSQLFAAEKPHVSKLLSTLVSHAYMSNKRDSENEAHLQGRPMSRKLQHYISADRGFLPWERRKFFHDLLEVRCAFNILRSFLLKCLILFCSHRH